MSADPTTSGNADATPRGASAPASSMGFRQALREIRKGIVVMWWSFFDWLAVISWKALLLVSLLAMVLAAMLKHPMPVFFFIIASFIIKVVARGKRRAELKAIEATRRADTEQLERTVLEARMEALQAQIEPHFLFNTLASIDQLIQTDPPRASKMQQSLIRYLRSAMPQMREGQPTDAGPAGRSVQRLPGDHGGAHGRTPAVRRECSGRLEVGGLPVDDAADPGGERDQAWPGAEARGRPRSRSAPRSSMASWPSTCSTPAWASCRKPTAAWDSANVRERLKALYDGRAELIISVPPEGGTCATIRVPYEVAPASA